VERNKAKIICLGVMYGMGTSSVASKLDIDVKQAKLITNAFFQEFRAVHNWMNEIKAYIYIYI
jgi:DNA polymerase I-like protein with 3'-5' exonuclease and polymerase domains